MSMESRIEITDHIIFRRFEGDITVHTIIESWETLLSAVEDLGAYKGVITDLLHANLIMDMEQLEVLLNYLTEKLVNYGRLKLAVLINNTQVILPIMADKKQEEFNIKPFVTEEAALIWMKS
jgi:hypothetical protein